MNVDLRKALVAGNSESGDKLAPRNAARVGYICEGWVTTLVKERIPTAEANVTIIVVMMNLSPFPDALFFRPIFLLDEFNHVVTVEPPQR